MISLKEKPEKGSEGMKEQEKKFQEKEEKDAETSAENIEEKEADKKDSEEKAEDKKLDLVLVAPNNNPKVCRIMNYGKYKFEQAKKEKKARKKQK